MRRFKFLLSLFVLAVLTLGNSPGVGATQMEMKELSGNCTCDGTLVVSHPVPGAIITLFVQFDDLSEGDTTTVTLEAGKTEYQFHLAAPTDGRSFRVAIVGYSLRSSWIGPCVPKATDTPTSTDTPTPTDTPTATNTPEDTPTDTATATETAEDTPTDTPTEVDTETPEDTPTGTIVDTATSTSTAVDTATTVPTETTEASVTPEATNTPVKAVTPPTKLPDTGARSPDSSGGYGSLATILSILALIMVFGGTALKRRSNR